MTNLARQLQELRSLWRREQTKVLEFSSVLLNSLAAKLKDKKVQRKILSANRQDLLKLTADDPMYDRLLLNEKRLQEIAANLVRVAALPSPVGRELYHQQMANGAQIYQRRVPIGLLLVIYESRPNVTIDLFALALRTGNLLLLKGGKEALASNSCLEIIIREELQDWKLAPEWLNLLQTSHQELAELLQQQQYIDLCIPRGSANLINFVRENSSIPVIETGAGVVHLFCDQSAQPEMAAKLIQNSKMRRLSVCNALDCLLLHKNLLPQLPRLVAKLASAEAEHLGVLLHCDAPSLAALQKHYPAKLLLAVESYGREFLSAQMSIKVVASLDAAIKHIEQYGSRHTEVIVTQNKSNAERFCQEVDAASVFVNMASGFADGGQFGLGAEVGISTQKLHARGPMGPESLTCQKWFGRGQGQLREAIEQ